MWRPRPRRTYAPRRHRCTSTPARVPSRSARGLSTRSGQSAIVAWRRDHRRVPAAWRARCCDAPGGYLVRPEARAAALVELPPRQPRQPAALNARHPQASAHPSTTPPGDQPPRAASPTSHALAPPDPPRPSRPNRPTNAPTPVRPKREHVTRANVKTSKEGERGDSNPRPPGPQPGALPTELRPPRESESTIAGAL